jgi:C4-dicarboxylate-specific signal transduction histidine kinase
LPVRGAAGPLAQVLLHLLLNAARALDHVQGAREISMSARREGDRLCLEVTDSAPRGDVHSSWHRFQPSLSARGFEIGSGFGLSLSREVMLRYGGDLHVRLQPGGGTVFSVLIPAAP